MFYEKQDNSQPLSARSSVGSEYLATNQVVGGSNPSGRAIFSLDCNIIYKFKRLLKYGQ